MQMVEVHILRYFELESDPSLIAQFIIPINAF